ncbi:hypothetical protein FB480_107119 [Agrobacterium vitis]|nr:hypothetical protein FB480_107119 [Agrobacterium vitis]
MAPSFMQLSLDERRIIVQMNDRKISGNRLCRAE